jgi:hypothetical protein
MHECPRCNYETKYKYNLMTHFDRKEACKSIDNDIPISECKALFKSGKLKTDITILKCIYCNKIFDRKVRLNSHLVKCKNKEENSEMLKEYKVRSELKINELQSMKNTKVIELKAKSLKELLMKAKREDKDEFIYLLKTREFVNSGQDIYKIGKTVNPTNRMGNYGKGAKVKMMHWCNDCDKSERELIKLFDEKFIKQVDIGREYYKGELHHMVNEINSYFYNKTTHDVLTAPPMRFAKAPLTVSS